MQNQPSESSTATPHKQLLRIIHFNDVYDLQPGDKQPIGGVAAFLTGINQYKNPNTLTLFSGDVFSPSVLSDVYNGKHMIQPLNAFGIDAACFGNHDFDFELDVVMELKNLTNFPWFLSNVYDKKTGNRLGDAEEFRVFERGGIRIGIFGLAEKEWLDTLLVEYLPRCHYLDFVDYAIEMVRVLKEEQKCDIIIALTHMMGYNDAKLVNKVDGIDLVLGGHDHMIRHQQIRDTVVVKSGTNFKNFTVLKILQGPATPQNKYSIQKGKYIVDHTLQQVTRKFKPDPKLEAHVTKMYAQFQVRQNSIVCISDVDLDLRFGVIRMSESPFINMVADWYRFYTNAECVILCAGNFRIDGIVKSGPVTYGDMTNQILDQVVMKKVPGTLLLAALENSVAMYPNLSGRFANFSGIEFTWDSSKQPFHRVLLETVKINSQPINLQKVYLVGSHHFHSCGGDGFACLKDCEYAIKSEEGIANKTLVLEMLDPKSERSIKYRQLIAKTSNEHDYRVIQHSGKEVIAFKPGNTRRTVKL